MATTERDFMQWMRDKKKPDDSAYYNESTINQYAAALRSKLAKYWERDEPIESNLFDYADVDEFSAVRQSLLKSSKFLADIANPDKGDFGDHKKAMELYEEFLREYTMSNTLLKAEDNSQFWLYSPGSGAKCWSENFELGIICIGWDDVGDLAQYATFEELDNAVKQHCYPNSNESDSTKMLWAFAHDMKVGDIVFAKKGDRQIIGWGEITSESIFDASRTKYTHTRKVKWLSSKPMDWSGESMLSTKTLILVNKNSKHHYKLASLLNGNIQMDSNVLAKMQQAEPERDLSYIFKAIAETGLRLNESILRRYHISLTTRGFVILAGVSGTGKTWLAQAYADVINAKSLVVPVAPNWNSNEDLLGHYNPFSENFCPTSFTSFLEEAADDESSTEYHLILDEMNLARVEHYFAKFLSAMELRQRGEAALDLGGGKIIPLPQTLKFIGTVNIDETTHGFADKVYDRAQLIELPLDRILLAEHIAGKNFAPLLMKIWDAVHRSAPFAFRILDEISVYVTKAESYGVSWQTALDEMTVQKILPRLKGHDAGIGSSLTELKEIAVDNNMTLTTEKAEYMLVQFNEYGFSSFFQK